MKKPSAMRKILLGFLILLYTLSSLGVFSSYFSFYFRPHFRAQVSLAKKDELKTLSLTASEFENINWIEINKEFEYQDKMYDVAKIEKEGSGYLIYCENDSLEDLFFNWLKSESKSASKVIVQIHFFEPINYFECSPVVLTNEVAINTFTNLYLSITQELVTPPPRLS